MWQSWASMNENKIGFLTESPYYNFWKPIYVLKQKKYGAMNIIEIFKSQKIISKYLGSYWGYGQNVNVFTHKNPQSSNKKTKIETSIKILCQLWPNPTKTQKFDIWNMDHWT